MKVCGGALVPEKLDVVQPARYIALWLHSYASASRGERIILRDSMFAVHASRLIPSQANLLISHSQCLPIIYFITPASPIKSTRTRSPAVRRDSLKDDGMIPMGEHRAHTEAHALKGGLDKVGIGE
jgi:hypothetical protein